jgi:hypothetical protein
MFEFSAAHLMASSASRQKKTPVKIEFLAPMAIFS